MTENKRHRGSYSALEGFHRAIPIILIAAAVFFGLCFITQDIGALGHAFSGLFLGLFSYGAYAIPFLIILHAVFYPSDLAEKRILSRAIFSLLTVIAISSLVYAVSIWGESEIAFTPAEYYRNGQARVGGGFIGGVISFGLMKVFGKVGLVIIALAVFATYVSYFFARGRYGIKDVGMAILRGIVGALAFCERKIKGLVKRSRDRRAAKRSAEAAAKCAELTSDEFFAVDSGIESLRISELGINETRDRASLEANPTLQESVFHRSRAEEGAESAFREAPVYETAERPKRRVVDPTADVVFDVTPEEEPTAPSPAAAGGERPSDFGIDESAESVFSGSFDPFKLAMSETLANKPSSKSLLDEAGMSPTVTETIAELSEEEIERARRNDAFERRKAQVVAARRAEATPVVGEGEFVGEHKPIEFHETRDEGPDRGISVEGETSLTIDKDATEEVGAYRPSYTGSSDVHFERRFDSTAAATDTAGVAEQPSAEPVGAAQINTGTDSSPAVSEPSTTGGEATARARSAYERAAGFAAAGSEARVTAPVGESAATDTVKVSYVTTSDSEEKTAEEFKPFEVPETTAPREGLVFEFGGAAPEAVAPQSIVVERTVIAPDEHISDEEDPDDAEEEITESEAADGGEDDEGWCDEEIPPEERNPRISEYRDMFSCFRGTEDTEETVEDTDCEEPTEYADADGYTDTETDTDTDEDEPPFDTPAATSPVKDDEPPFDTPASSSAARVAPGKEEEPPKKKADYSHYVMPPLSLLGLEESHDDEEINNEINENTRILIETLESFNVTASIKGVDRGPRITRYEVVPARGVKVNQITHLFDDIALNLAAEGIRMEAPIPGKSAIGFEIPNKNPSAVRLRELLECEEFINAKSKTFVCIGKDVAGKPVFGDIAKFPHALVAGATGMGKSVCINSLMISMLYKARPDEVKFIMIDPKKVEFKMYSGIPHLLIPVITEAKQAAGALMWAVEEMERRYDLIEQLNLRNIEAYNERCMTDKSIGEPMPKIVIVIDELNDLMMQVRDPVEQLIMRIAQKARAAGIHLIIGTQRPDVKVVTGTIKANINTRISCKVTSVVDSRTILEMAGAERLLNRGDMLFKPVDKTKPVRVQGALVLDSEVEDIMNFLKGEADGAVYDDEIFAEINRAAQKCGNKKSSAQDMDDDDGDQCGYYSDQQFLDAVELAIRSGKVSTSLLQRKLSIGYGKAAKYIDAMQEIGVVSEPNGQKPRDVLITLDEWHEKLTRVEI